MKKFRRKVLDMLMSNNSGSSLRQQLLDGAPFRSSLLYTAVPQRAASGTTGTFTRATTSTWPNNDGYMVTGVAGEIGFPGARRVRNLLTLTEDFSTAVWSKSNASMSANQIAAPNGTTTADLFTATANAQQTVWFAAGITGVYSTVYSAYVKAGTATWLNFTLWDGAGVLGGGIQVWFNLSTGAVGSSVVGAGFSLTGTSTESVGAGWYRIAIAGTATGGAFVPAFRITDSNGVNATTATNGKTFYIWGAQVEDVTAQTTQTAGEYVSVGVPSDWAGDELATNGTFDTDTTGWTLSNATAAVSSGEVTLTNTAAAYGTLRQAITTVVGTKYILSGTARVGSATIAYVQAGTYAGAGDLLALSTSSSSNTFLTGTFTATGTTTHLSVAPDATSGHTAIFDNISVKPAYYHGSMVDGVKCFPTDLSGNTIPSTTLLGYQAEGARTNLCLRSNDPSNASWTKSSFITTTQNAVSPDGATNAWTVAATTGATFAVFLQNITVAADTNSYTASCFVKKTTGTPATYPMFELQHSSATKTAGVVINTTAGTLANRVVGGSIVAPDAKTITSYNDDWWRVTVTLANNSGTTSTIAFYPSINSDGTGVIASGTLGSAVFYGAQVELGSFASSYIATTTTAVTRNADVLTYSGGDVPNLKTLSATFRRESGVSAAGEVLALSDNTLNNTVVIQMDNATLVRSYGVAGGVTQWNQTASNSYTAGSDSKVAVTFATNDVKSFFAGTSMTADTSATVPVVTRLEVGMVTSLYQLYGTTKGIYGWTRNLSQSELQAVTS